MFDSKEQRRPVAQVCHIYKKMGLRKIKIKVLEVNVKTKKRERNIPRSKVNWFPNVTDYVFS